MFTVLASNYGEPRELSPRSDRYNGSTFSHGLAADGSSGTVTLQPENCVLRVGSGHDDYESVRIFAEDGLLVALMLRSADGSVRWMEPTRA